MSHTWSWCTCVISLVILIWVSLSVTFWYFFLISWSELNCNLSFGDIYGWQTISPNIHFLSGYLFWGEFDRNWYSHFISSLSILKLSILLFMIFICFSLSFLRIFIGHKGCLIKMIRNSKIKLFSNQVTFQVSFIYSYTQI